MPITLTVFAASPDRGRGLARDCRIRWALEEVGQPYDTRAIAMADLRQPDHLARNPFGQIPTYEEDGFVLFESGAILLHVAGCWPGLLPTDPAARARAVMWVFAALNTVEPPILDLANAKLLEGDAPWAAARLPLVQDRLRTRLAALSARFGTADWLEDGFSAGDLMMISVLLRIKGRVLDEFANLSAYVARGEARPAYQRAFAAQAAQAALFWKE